MKGDKAKKIKMVLIILGILLFFGFIIFFIKSLGEDKSGTGDVDVETHIEQKSDLDYEFDLVDSEDSLIQTKFMNKTEKDMRDAMLKAKQSQLYVKKLENEVRNIKGLMQKQNRDTFLQNPPSEDNGNKNFENIFSKFPNELPKPPDGSGFKKLFNSDEKKESFEYEEVEESMVISLNQEVNSSTEQKNEEGEKVPKDAFFLPAGTITVAYLEQGFDASTLKNGKNDLVPSTYTIVGLSLLPNRKLFDLRGCRILAEAEAKRSNERAYLRTRRISCINDNNKVMDVPLDGYISDEEGDGKLGLNGDIVTMQDKLLQNTIWLSIAEGVGELGRESARVTSTSSLGTTTGYDFNANSLMIAGAGAGVSEASSTIKDFLMENIKSIEPVVEIKGGRFVAVTLSRGLYIYPRVYYKKAIK